MIRVAPVAIAASLLLAACSQGGTTDASAAPAKPKDFCHAMQAAATAAQPAATQLDTLFNTIDGMAAGATDGDIDALHSAGTASAEASQAYVDALSDAKELAPESLATDIGTLSSYWTLYAIGMADIAADAPSYGKLVDQTQALATSQEASQLIQDQPSAQQRINDGYLKECAG